MDAGPPYGIVFVCVDPLGRHVVLREDTWYDHILHQHVELAGQDAGVERAVSQPDTIRIDADDPMRRVYYAFNVVRPPFHGQHLKVVVEFTDAWGERMVYGEIVTAFVVARVKRQEKHEW